MALVACAGGGWSAVTPAYTGKRGRPNGLAGDCQP